MTNEHKIIGTWRLRSFHVWDTTGAHSEPLGKDPKGFAVFDSLGNVFIQILRGHDVDAESNPSEHQEIASSYGGYFGTYVVDEPRATLSIHVHGSNMPDYIRSVQQRVFTVTGSVLEMGQPGRYRAVADRVA